MHQHDELNCISHVPIFKNLPLDLRQDLVHISTHQQFFKKGSLIHAPGDGHDTLFAGSIGAKSVSGSFTVLSVNFLRDAGGFFTLYIHHGNLIAFLGKPMAEIRPQGLSSTNDNGNLTHVFLLNYATNFNVQPGVTACGTGPST